MKHNAKSMATLKKAFRYIKRYTPLIVLSVLSALVTVFLSLWIPLRIGHAIDFIVDRGNVNFAEITKILTEVILSIAASALFSWIMGVINNRVTYKIVRDIRNEAFVHIQKLPLSYIDTHAHGETTSRIISDVDTFADGLLIGFTQLFSGILTLVGALVFMFMTDARIAAVIVVLTPLSLLIARFIATRTHSMFLLQSKTRAEQTGHIAEMLGEAKTVKSLAYEDDALRRFDEINGRLKDCSLRAIFFSSLVNPTTRFINSMIYGVVVLFGALCVLPDGVFGIGGGALTVGTLVAMLSYVNQYTKPFNEISGVVTEFSGALASGARVFELMEEEGEPEAVGEAPSELCGNVALENVSFCYTKDKPLIENLSLSVKAGERIAIVGPTGCGKTTLINLLMRFYDVKGGQILLEGKDIRSMSRRALRSGYGMVLQETWLKEATIRENIAMGRPDATMDEIVAAAKATHAHSFIKRLPMGYETVVGEGIGGLSEGERQLLCITRVMLSLPPMLILDEATSSIDTRTEMHIQRSFGEMMQGRTSFIVAHRLSTVREADLILVMRDGHIVEQGTHEELLGKGGFYAELYHSQFAHTA